MGAELNYRDKQLLRAAQGNQCQWCFRHDGTVVAAHANQLRYGKGMGIKAHDWAVAFLCHSCHGELDQGSWMSRDQRRLLWDTAHQRTRNILREMGLLVESEDLGAGQAGAEGASSIRSGSDVHAEDDPSL
jgi:hypothetical protein